MVLSNSAGLEVLAVPERQGHPLAMAMTTPPCWYQPSDRPENAGAPYTDLELRGVRI
jgi:hypothetical protein